MRNKIYYYRIRLVAYDLIRRSHLPPPMSIASPYPTPLPAAFHPLTRRSSLRKLQLLPLPSIEELPHLK